MITMSLIVKANQFLHHGKIKQAEPLYRQLLQENPNNIDALWGLGKVALALDSYQASYDIFNRCVQLSANIPPLWLSLAQACEKLHRFEQAEQSLLKSYSLNKEHKQTVLALAIFYCQSNQLIQAKQYLDELTHIDPDNIQAFCLKVRINEQDELEESKQSFLTKLTTKKANFSQQEQVLLHYAFADLFQREEDYQKAHYHFTQANSLQRTSISFSVADMQDYFSLLIDTFSKSFMAKIISTQVSKEQKLTPIFIVGQPRSGSTLLEQMLISHSEISSAGELPFLAGDIAQGIFQLTGQEFPIGCKQLTSKQCELLGQHYLANMQSIAPTAKFIIDKMPANYQSIGLIKMLLPHAKIIHISRAVKEVSWSIFTNHFDAPEPYFCSLTEIADYHKNYREVMLHWQQLLPEFIHNISYEDLVRNPKEALIKLLKFCSLSFQDECLNFTEKQRHIGTLSDVQLRNGLQVNLKAAWLPYEQYLPDCFNELTE